MYQIEIRTPAWATYLRAAVCREVTFGGDTRTAHVVKGRKEGETFEHLESRVRKAMELWLAECEAAGRWVDMVDEAPEDGIQRGNADIEESSTWAGPMEPGSGPLPIYPRKEDIPEVPRWCATPPPVFGVDMASEPDETVLRLHPAAAKLYREELEARGFRVVVTEPMPLTYRGIPVVVDPKLHRPVLHGPIRPLRRWEWR